MKKIIYIGNNLETGNPTTMMQLSELLKAHGNMVVTYSPKNNKIARFIDMLFGVVKHRNADVVLIDTYSTQNFYYALVVSQVARLLKIPYIPILHGGNLPQRLKKNRLFSKWLFKNAFINVAPSNYLFTEFKQKEYKTVLIPNAIELVNYPFQLPTFTNPKLLWVRAFDAIYNPKMAIDVLLNLRINFPNAKLCMIGPDKDGSMQLLKDYVSAKGLEDFVEFSGFLQKKDWIEKSKNFNFFINTTTIDNAPVSVIEAMAVGLPVISTNVGGIPYLITSNKNGILVKNGAVEEMVAAIDALMNDPTKTTEIIIKARKLAESYDVQCVGNQWEKLLADV